MCVWAFTISWLFKCPKGEVRVKPIRIQLERGTLYFLKGIVELLYTGLVPPPRGAYAVVAITP